MEVAKGHYELVAATLPAMALKGLVLAPDRPVSVNDMSAAVRRQAAKAMES